MPLVRGERWKGKDLLNEVEDKSKDFFFMVDIEWEERKENGDCAYSEVDKLWKTERKRLKRGGGLDRVTKSKERGGKKGRRKSNKNNS